MDTLFRKDALDYHAKGRPGKLEVVPTKPYSTQRDLSLAYTPGVADPCLAIKDNPQDVYKYTAKGNLVAVISNGTAVLGLGDIGPEAGKPVMEGKGYGYVRVSRDQEDKLSDDVQREKIEAACKIKEIDFEKHFEDLDVSGRVFSRPGWGEMLAPLKAGAVL